MLQIELTNLNETYTLLLFFTFPMAVCLEISLLRLRKLHYNIPKRTKIIGQQLLSTSHKNIIEAH